MCVSYSILFYKKNQNRKIICNKVLTRLSSKAWLPQHISRSVQFQFVFLILTITHPTTITVTAIYWRQIICKLHARSFVIPNPQNSPSSAGVIPNLWIRNWGSGLSLLTLGNNPRPFRTMQFFWIIKCRDNYV